MARRKTTGEKKITRKKMAVERVEGGHCRRVDRRAIYRVLPNSSCVTT